MSHLGFLIAVCGLGLINVQLLGLGFGLDLSEHSALSTREWWAISLLTALMAFSAMLLDQLTRR